MYQVNLPVARTDFDLLFCLRMAKLDIITNFIIDKFMDVVFPGEDAAQTVSMLIYPARQIVASAVYRTVFCSMMVKMSTQHSFPTAQK